MCREKLTFVSSFVFYDLMFHRFDSTDLRDYCIFSDSASWPAASRLWLIIYFRLVLSNFRLSSATGLFCDFIPTDFDPLMPAIFVPPQ